MLLEELRVLAWRERMIADLGLPGEMVEACLLLDVDWHELERLLAEGCEPGLALRILA